MDSTALLERISEAISLGNVDATEWGTQAEWQRDMTMLHEAYVQEMGERLVKEARRIFETLGYRAVFERPGAILGLVSHMMLAEDKTLDTLQSYVDDSSQIAQFIQLCQSPTALRNAALKLSPSTPTTVSTSKSQSATGSLSPESSLLSLADFES